MRKSISIVFVVALVLLVWLVFWFAEQQRSDSAMQVLLSSQTDAFERELNQLSFVPRILSNEPTIVQAALHAKQGGENPTHPSFNLANIRLKETQVASGLEFSFLLDQKGVTIAASNWQDTVSFVGQSYSFRPYFKEAISGQPSTYYAVGATTGIPGYFIAEPVFFEGETIGVVVVKLSLSAVSQSWGTQNANTVVVDEFGVVVLSSTSEFLYQPTEKMDVSTVGTLRAERRYGLFLPESNGNSAHHLLDLHPYRIQKQEIDQSPWHMLVLFPDKKVALRALYNAIAAYALLLICWLLYSLYRQQRLTVAAEQRVSRELEAQVRERSTELEKIQKTLIAESNFAMLGRMSAAINHEVNQPLATLRLNLASLRALLEEPSMSDDNWGSVQQIVTESDLTTKRIARVITSLRSYSRKNRVNPQNVNMVELLNEVRTTIDTERPNMSTLVQYCVDDHVLPVSGDSTLLQQGILNLLYNAFDAVLETENPQVQISAAIDRTQSSTDTEASEKIVISVSDNGSGISASVAESLFDPFTTDSLDRGGLGLGLTITQQIIESHDGTLICDSSSSGSRFTIQLPSALNKFAP